MVYSKASFEYKWEIVGVCILKDASSVHAFVQSACACIREMPHPLVYLFMRINNII